VRKKQPVCFHDNNPLVGTCSTIVVPRYPRQDVKNPPLWTSGILTIPQYQLLYLSVCGELGLILSSQSPPTFPTMKHINCFARK